MSRRPLQHPVGALAKAQSRMAPGGLLWSESPIPRVGVRRVPMLGDVEVDPPPEPEPFPTPEAVFGAASYTSVGTVLFDSLSWDGSPVAMTPSGVWTALPGTTDYTIEVKTQGSPLRWTGAFRLTNGTGFTSRWYSTLTDADGVGTDAESLVSVTATPAVWYLHQSTDPAVPSMQLSAAQTLKVYQFWAPPLLLPPSGLVGASGSVRFSTTFGAASRRAHGR